MPRRGPHRGQVKVYRCDEPPCIHVVIDERKRLVQVFFEDEEYITPVPLKVLLRACEDIKKAMGLGAREASGAEVDELARKYLDATPVEEVVEDEEPAG